MTERELLRLANVSTLCGYNVDHKKEFRRLSRKMLKELADLTQLGSADLRWNEGGIAVSGEATLHADNIYIQVSGTDMGILYRSCKSRKDYTGGRNCWYPWTRLVQFGVKGFAAQITQVLTVPTDTDKDFEQALEARRRFHA